MACDRGISLAKVLLQADIGQCVLPEDGLGIQVGCHESTLSRESLQEKTDDKNIVFLILIPTIQLLKLKYARYITGCFFNWFSSKSSKSQIM